MPSAPAEPGLRERRLQPAGGWRGAPWSRRWRLLARRLRTGLLHIPPRRGDRQVARPMRPPPFVTPRGRGSSGTTGWGFARGRGSAPEAPDPVHAARRTQRTAVAPGLRARRSRRESRQGRGTPAAEPDGPPACGGAPRRSTSTARARRPAGTRDGVWSAPPVTPRERGSSGTTGWGLARGRGTASVAQRPSRMGPLRAAVLRAELDPVSADVVVRHGQSHLNGADAGSPPAPHCGGDSRCLHALGPRLDAR